MKDFKALLPLLRPYRYRYLAGFITLLVVDAAQMVIPRFLKTAVDLIQTGSFGVNDILKPALSMVGVMGIIAFGRFLWRYFIHGSSRRIEAEMRQRLFDHLMLLSGDFYQKNKIGDLMARTTNDIGSVRNAIGWGVVGLVDGTIMALAILVIIFLQNARLSLWAVLPLPPITIVIALSGKFVGKRFFKAQEAYSGLSDAVRETFAGVRVVKSFVKEDYFTKRFEKANNAYRDANMNIVKVFGLLFPLVTLLSGLTMLAVLFFGGRQAARGLISAGDLVAMYSYMQMLIWPVLGAGFTVNLIQRGMVSLKRVNEIMDTAPSIQNAEKPVYNGRNYENAIEIRGLDFSYPADFAENNTDIVRKETEVLQNITFSVKRGAWLGITGKTGSGKSTLLKTLPRLVDPPSGTVFVDGVDVREWDIGSLRGKFGFVSQDCCLFSDTIARNIGYGAQEGQEAQEGNGETVERAAALAGLERDIASFASGLDTLIGERGMSLSGGQKQRVTIARALFVTPEILVLDDSLSACDAETEKRVLANLALLRKGKTTIIVSHRVSAFRLCDNALVLDTGKLSEYGPPETLAASSGYYAKTARLQTLAVDEEGGESNERQKEQPC